MNACSWTAPCHRLCSPSPCWRRGDGKAGGCRASAGGMKLREAPATLLGLRPRRSEDAAFGDGPRERRDERQSIVSV